MEEHGASRGATHDTILRRMRFARWITKATEAPPDYVILTTFPQQQGFRERSSILRCTDIACLFLFLGNIQNSNFHQPFAEHLACLRGPPGFRETQFGKHSCKLSCLCVSVTPGGIFEKQNGPLIMRSLKHR